MKNSQDKQKPAKAAAAKGRDEHEMAAGPSRVDLSESDIERRPLAGADVTNFGGSYGLERMQVIDLLALPTPAAFSALCRTEDKPLPHALEMLLRFHLEDPPKNRRVTPKEVFDKIYGPLLEPFEGQDCYDTARVMLQHRFAALFGNTVYSAYRWLRRSVQTQTYGEASPPIRRLLQLIPQEPGPMRKTLERLARTTWRTRGVDFEKEFPLPNPANPPAPRRMGPQQEMKLQRREALRALIANSEALPAQTVAVKKAKSAAPASGKRV